MLTRQQGFSLIEFMIAVVISLFVLAGVTTLFSITLKSNADTLKATRLNQEQRAVMDLMVRDIRRAEYWANATSAIGLGAAANTYAALNPFDATLNTATPGCILFAYDLNSNGTLDTGSPDERYGFLLDDAAVKMRKGGTDFTCTPGSAWEKITDANTTEITGLAFTPTARVIDIDGSGSGNSTVTVRQITISLRGRLKNDTNVSRTLTETVRVRNDLFTYNP